jgi:replication-associated recombination protein RarA
MSTFKSFGEIVTHGGYAMAEVASAFQKCIRRGEEEEALFWGSELELSGYVGYAWKRMLVVCSEDVGPGQPGIVAEIAGLHANWQALASKKDATHKPERLPFMHAIILLARAQKSRVVDNACVVFFMGQRPRREIPDFALDKHTRRGRGMKRGFDHFFAEGAVIRNENPDCVDPYKDSARHLLVSGAGKPEQEELL